MKGFWRVGNIGYDFGLMGLLGCFFGGGKRVSRCGFFLGDWGFVGMVFR